MGGSSIKISVKNVFKSFEDNNGKIDVLKDISINVKENEFLLILGPGQCGKTVLLNIISGIMRPDKGEVMVNGDKLDGPNKKIGVVFQKTGLLPWKTVIQNVEFGLKMNNIPQKERTETAKYFINLVGLNGFENMYPRQLSGGMKQRVGIARAYANNTEILLMDEPFGALDAQTRYLMEEEILKIWDKEKRTVIFVTNNLEEAIYLGDRIILLSKCPATIKEIYIPKISKPRDYMAPEFLSLRNIITDNFDMAI